MRPQGQAGQGGGCEEFSSFHGGRVGYPNDMAFCTSLDGKVSWAMLRSQYMQGVPDFPVPHYISRVVLYHSADPS